jgi:hypothetical protein
VASRGPPSAYGWVSRRLAVRCERDSRGFNFTSSLLAVRGAQDLEGLSVNGHWRVKAWIPACRRLRGTRQLRDRAESHPALSPASSIAQRRGLSPSVTSGRVAEITGGPTVRRASYLRRQPPRRANVATDHGSRSGGRDRRELAPADEVQRGAHEDLVHDR